jgi:pimeloyl-ACP methyl ester carboxylesterase
MNRITLHGYDLSYVDLGQGPAVVFVHGLMSSHRTWGTQPERLARRHRVVAPDLYGHGESDKPVGDYSLGAHAATLRDLLDALDIRSATLVGHSLGGGIAMQFAYLFPDRVNGIVLVSSGGLGPELHPLLRAATLPGSELVLPVLASGWVHLVGDTALKIWSMTGLPGISPSSSEAWHSLTSLADGDTRRAFLATSRSVIDMHGQTVSARNRLSGIAGLPTLLLWGGSDKMIPSSHVEVAREELPASRVEIFDRAGHFPHLDEPDRFAQVLEEFMLSGAQQAPADTAAPVEERSASAS